MIVINALLIFCFAIRCTYVEMYWIHDTRCTNRWIDARTLNPGQWIIFRKCQHGYITTWLTVTYTDGVTLKQTPQMKLNYGMSQILYTSIRSQTKPSSGDIKWDHFDICAFFTTIPFIWYACGWCKISTLCEAEH